MAVIDSDNFNRPNASILGTTANGRTWQIGWLLPGSAPVWSIVSNKAACTTQATQATAYVDLGTDQVNQKVTITGSVNSPRLIFRREAGANNLSCLALTPGTAGGGTLIAVSHSGGGTTLATFTCALGQVLQGIVKGGVSNSTFEIIVDGVSQSVVNLSAVSQAKAGSTNFGIMSDQQAGPSFDDWSASDLSVGSGWGIGRLHVA